MFAIVERIEKDELIVTEDIKVLVEKLASSPALPADLVGLIQKLCVVVIKKLGSLVRSLHWEAEHVKMYAQFFGPPVMDGDANAKVWAEFFTKLQKLDESVWNARNQLEPASSELARSLLGDLKDALLAAEHACTNVICADSSSHKALGCR